MGFGVQAQCSQCRYSTNLTLGAGMADFTTREAWPVYCRRCMNIRVSNHLEAPTKCCSCNDEAAIPISDIRVYAGDGEIIHRWGELMLTSGHYCCPVCEEMTLTFGKWKTFLFD